MFRHWQEALYCPEFPAYSVESAVPVLQAHQLHSVFPLELQAEPLHSQLLLFQELYYLLNEYHRNEYHTVFLQFPQFYLQQHQQALHIHHHNRREHNTIYLDSIAGF